MVVPGERSTCWLLAPRLPWWSLIRYSWEGGGVPVRYFFEGLDFGVIFVSWEEVTEELPGHSLYFVEIVFGCFGLGGLVARF